MITNLLFGLFSLVHFRELFSTAKMGNCVSAHSFTPNESVPGQSSSVVPMALELGYERSDIDRMFRYNKSPLSLSLSECVLRMCSAVLLKIKACSQ